MKNTTENQHELVYQTHIVSNKEHLSTLSALLLMTILTVSISVFGANLRSLSVATALLIATVKVIVVAYYFMHLKFDKKIYTLLVMVTVVLYLSFLVLISIEYLNR